MIKQLLLIACAVLTACGAHEQSTSELTTKADSAQAESLPTALVPGKVCEIQVASGENATCYLPSQSAADKHLPLILFFDPHAESKNVVEKYKGIAESQACIIVASSNSKNGLAIDESSNYASHLLNYMLAHVKVDSTKIYVAGFSGGAKVAMALAKSDTRVKGVVYCGAVLPDAYRSDLSWIGFAGLRDMNYADLIDFDAQLSSTNHVLIEWKGIHAWPDSAVFVDAFEFIKNHRVSNYAAKKITTQAAVLIKEQQVKQSLMQALQERDIVWWTNSIQDFNKMKKSELMYERILGFVSLACYSYVNAAIQQRDKNASQHFLQIYRLADPTNTAIPELQAKADAL